MKRDPSIIREILFALEDGADDVFNTLFVCYPADVVYYHLVILAEQGFISDVHCQKNHMGAVIGIYGDMELTFSGHEFLDTIRPDGIWDKVKGYLATYSGPLSVQLIANLLTK